jgi:integrase/recombinase XerD
MGDRHWEKLIEKSSIKALGYKINPHTLRHSCATYLLENGWDIKEVQEYLGHESIMSTEIYLHINKGRLKEKANKF